VVVVKEGRKQKEIRMRREKRLKEWWRIEIIVRKKREV